MSDEKKMPCNCGYITLIMSEPDSPISIYQGLFLLNDSWVMYFCPSCGGKLPDSSKPIYVPFLSQEERARLELLTLDIRTREEAVERLGMPDSEEVAYMVREDGLVFDEQVPPTQTVEYRSLSETAIVEFFFNDERPPSCQITPKFLPPRHVEEELPEKQVEAEVTLQRD